MTHVEAGDRSEEFFSTFTQDPQAALRSIENVTEFDANLEYLSKFAESILWGAIPIIYANHQSFADGLLLGRVSAELQNNSDISASFRGYRLPSSATAESQPLHQVLLPIYNANGIFPVGVFTDEEIKARPEERRQNRLAALTLIQGPTEGYGLAFFPEASPAGGIKLPDGSIQGMQQVEREDLRGYIRTFKKRYEDRPVVFLPVGIDGSHELYMPETNLPGPLAVKAVCDRAKQEPFIRITIGESIPSTKIQGDTNTYLMGAVAELLPEEARGAYN